MTTITLPKTSQTGANEWADVEDNDVAIRDVVNGNLDNANISATAAIAFSKLGTLSTGQFVVGNGGTATAATMSGDATVSSTGVVTIANDAVTAAKIAANAVDSSEIAADAVGSSEIAANAVGASELDENAVTAWTTWVPTWANATVGNGTVTARYLQFGKLIFFTLDFTLGSTSSVGTGPTFTLPAAMQGTAMRMEAECTDISAVAGYKAITTYSAASTLLVQYYSVSGSLLARANITATAPFTWATGDSSLAQGVYETT